MAPNNHTPLSLTHRWLHTLLACCLPLLLSPPSVIAQCEGIPDPLEFVSPEETNIIEDELPVIEYSPFGFPAYGREGAVGVEGCGRFRHRRDVDATRISGRGGGVFQLVDRESGSQFSG